MKRVIGLFAAMLIFFSPGVDATSRRAAIIRAEVSILRPHGPEPYRGVPQQGSRQRGAPNQGVPQHNTRLGTYVHVQYFG